MKIYAFICPEDGHGILSIGDSLKSQKPLVAKSKEVAEKLIPIVKENFKASGLRIELHEFESVKSEVICIGSGLGFN